MGFGKRISVLGMGVLFLLAAFAGCDSPEASHTHTYAESWTTSETEHWHAATCEHDSLRGDLGSHVFEGRICTVCGYERPAGPEDVDPGENNPGGGDDTDRYIYGKNQKDAYDEAYTERLLSLGEQEFTRSQLSGVDVYGRVRTPDGGSREKRYVGIFYFMWLNESMPVYDISKMLEEYGETNLETSPLWAISGDRAYDPKISPMNAFHYFEEPLYGYYASTDKWVIRRHLELLAQAGVDFLYLDFTNANSGNPTKQPNNIYPEATYALMDSILELQEMGINVPKIVPMVCNPDTGSDKARGNVVEWVYHNYYAKDDFKYSSCWFRADPEHNPSQKPLLITYTIDRTTFTDKDAYDAFWFRKVVWPTKVTADSYKDGFPWMDYERPQANYDGVMNVSVAQHIGGSWSSKAYLARSLQDFSTRYRGRGALGSKVYAYESDDVEDANAGFNFAEQWNNVISTIGTAREPWMVSVTGWNEWVAQKLNFETHATFVDTFSIAFSRDAEMMRDKHGYGDNFYMQLATNVSRYKKLPSTRNSDAAMWKTRTIPMGDFEAWNGVKAKYTDFTGDAMNREKDSVGGAYTYTDDSARNDISYLKLANDGEALYVLIATKDEITPHVAGDEGWMNLWISTGNKGGWESFHYLVNRRPENGTTTIEKLGVDENGAITAETVGTSEFAVSGNMIMFRIPLKTIGVTSADELRVKASDNIFANRRTDRNDGVGVYEFGDIMAFYGGGDTAPLGRLGYAYRMAYADPEQEA